MINRRKFLQLTSITTPLLVTEKSRYFEEHVNTKPIVISTWDFGKAANTEAWKTLSAGGKVIDAVEAGVKIPEADPDNQSVGYGGLPDRDGHVTLDACIMDGSNLACGS